MLRTIAHLLLLSSLAAGCVAGDPLGEQATQLYARGRLDAAAGLLRPAAEQTDRNYVLNNLRLGATALAALDLDEAEAAYLRAWEVINAGGVNQGGRGAGAVLVSEDVKIWKGEPFERAVASFHLGVVYYLRGEYDNARGAFENALFKLRDYADDDADPAEQESDFAAALVMLGRTFQRLGREDLAAANFARAAELQPELAPLADPARHAASNLLLVVDFGYGPRKVGGENGRVAGFAPAPSRGGRIPPPRVLIDGSEAPLADVNRPTYDTLFMAQQRRWQRIDTIRSIKSLAGTGLIAAGAGYGVYRAGQDEFRAQDALISGGLIAAGLLLKAGSQADLRTWEMAPRTTFLLPLRAAPGVREIAVEFPGAGDLRQTWRGVVVPPSGETTLYLRMQRLRPGPFDWPFAPSDPPDAAP